MYLGNVHMQLCFWRKDESRRPMGGNISLVLALAIYIFLS